MPRNQKGFVLITTAACTAIAYSLVVLLIPDNLDHARDTALDAVEASIEDPSRREDASRIVRDMHEALDSDFERAAELVTATWEVDSRYRATSEDYRAALDAIGAELQSALRGQVRRRVDLATSFTPEEWARLGEETDRVHEEMGLGP